MTEKVIHSLAEIQQDLERMKAEFHRQLIHYVVRFVDNPIMSDSAREVPVRTGQLRRSGTNNGNAPPDMEGGPSNTIDAMGGVYVDFGYGTLYAVYVHENLEARHKPPTKAKFLEDPVNRHADELGTVILDVADKIFLGGGAPASGA